MLTRLRNGLTHSLGSAGSKQIIYVIHPYNILRALHSVFKALFFSHAALNVNILPVRLQAR